jgi:hypothetical protein
VVMAAQGKLLVTSYYVPFPHSSVLLGTENDVSNVKPCK